MMLGFWRWWTCLGRGKPGETLLAIGSAKVPISLFSWEQGERMKLLVAGCLGMSLKITAAHRKNAL